MFFVLNQNVQNSSALGRNKKIRPQACSFSGKPLPTSVYVGSHLEGSGIPRYPNTSSSTMGSSVRVSKIWSPFLLCRLTPSVLVFSASFGHTVTFRPKCTWSTYETLKISNLIKTWSLIFMQLMWLTEAFNAEVLNARNYLNRNISVV